MWGPVGIRLRRGRCSLKQRIAPLAAAAASAVAPGDAGECGLHPLAHPARRRRPGRPGQFEVGLELSPSGPHGDEMVIADRGYSGRGFTAVASDRRSGAIGRPAATTTPTDTR